MQLTLKDGRLIRLIGLHQYPTYGGVLAGLPGEAMNRRMIERALAEARASVFGERPACVLAPPVTTTRFASNRQRQTGEPASIKVVQRLPAITTIGWFICSDTLRDDSAFGSQLVVVWYQDDFGIPGDDATLAQLRTIDWRRDAQDYDL